LNLLSIIWQWLSHYSNLSLSMLQAEEIDRILDSNPHIIRHFQGVTMQRGDTTFLHGPTLAAVQDVHDGGFPDTRRIVQRALFRAGHRNVMAFATGAFRPHVIGWFTTGILDRAEGRGEIIYLTAVMEAQLWRGVAAREPDARWWFVEDAPEARSVPCVGIGGSAEVSVVMRAAASELEPDDVMTRAPDEPDEPPS
jgi:hypothetical protein